MSIITIQCRLVADEETLRCLWELMAQKNTPLIQELLEQLGKHPNFETWLQKSMVPQVEIKRLCDSLKTQERFADQPGRFYTESDFSSGIHLQVLVRATEATTTPNRGKRALAFDAKKRWGTGARQWLYFGRDSH